MQFALMNCGLLVAVEELDGIFDGQNVIGLFFIHLVEDRGERGGLARYSGAGNQHDPVSQVDDFMKSFREVELLKTWNVVGNNAHDDGAATTLFEDVDAKARHAGDAVR